MEEKLIIACGLVDCYWLTFFIAVEESSKAR